MRDKIKVLISKINHKYYVLAIILGIGLLCFPINLIIQPSNILTVLGLIFIIAAIVFTLIRNGFKKEYLGSKWVWVSMLVIIASTILQLIIDASLINAGNVLMVFVLFGVYYTARIQGSAILKPYPIATLIISLSIIIYGLFITRGSDTGGLISSYCAATGYIILGFMLCPQKWQKILLPIVGLALLLTGAAEAIFAVCMLGIIVLIRRDFSKYFWIVLTILLIIGGIWFGLGYGQELYNQASGNITAIFDIISGNTDKYGGLDNALNIATTSRWEILKNGFADFSPFGNGLNLFSFDNTTIHNVPLIIVDQLGIAAGLAWLVIVFYCLIKTKYKYIWATILILSVFDHFIWTQFSPYFWVLAGITISVEIKNDYIFRREIEQKS